MLAPEVLLSAVGYGLLLPAVVAVLALLLALRLGGGEALAVGIALASGFAALALTKQIERDDLLRPKEAWDWLPALGLLACVVASVELLAGKYTHFIRWIGRVVVAVVTAWLLVRAQSEERDTIANYWYAALALSVLVLWGILDWAAERRPGVVLAVLLVLIGLAAAALAELGDFLRLAQIAGVVPGALLGWAFVVWRRPSVSLCRAGIPALSVLLPAVLFVSYFNNFGDVPPSSYLLVLAAPLALGLAAFLPIGEAPAWRRVAVQAGAGLLPLVAALALAAPR